jgi:ABC-type polysaccharide/polyol phosphate export permease
VTPRTHARILYDVLSTLMHREWRQRVAKGRWVTLWTFIEPLLQIFAVAGLYVAYGRSTVAGQEAYMFLGIAIFSFVAFRNLATKPSDAITVSQGLLVYRQVHVFDLLLSKWAAETLAYVLLSAIGLTWLSFFEETLQVNTAGLALAVCVMLSLSFGITCILAWVRKERPWVTTYFRPVFFAMYVTSGALHPIWDLPEWVTDLLAYNPMDQVLELLRQSLLFNYVSPLPISKAYLLLWALGTLTLGVHLVMRDAERLRSR